jgi:hypothetical protein
LIKTLLSQKSSVLSRGLPVEKKALLIAAFISVFLFSAIAGKQFVDVGRANPYLWETIPPPRGTVSPTITLFSPKNNTVFPVNSVLLHCLVEVGNSTASYRRVGLWVKYKVDWLQNETMKTPIQDDDDFVNIYLTLTDMPDGNHSIIVDATEVGHIVREARAPRMGLIQEFSITSSRIVNFTVDTNSPTVQVLWAKNKTHTTPNVPLNFTVNELVSQITYSLDGQENVTISGNITLTGLPNGDHNVTIYATDNAGNIGASEIITFTVAEPVPQSEPFPTISVAASIASVAIIGAGVVLYFAKIKKASGKTKYPVMQFHNG